MKKSPKLEVSKPLGFFESRFFYALLSIIYLSALLIAPFLVLIDSIIGKLPFVMTIARVTALFGFSAIALQVILGSRLKVLDRPFGLDRLIGFHRKMAIIALIAIIIHPLALAVEYGASEILFSLGGAPQIVGKIALFLLIIGIALAILRARIKLDYNKWHILHKAMILILILGFFHSVKIGDDLEGGILLQWWRVLAITAASVFIFNNLIRQFLFRKKFLVDEVTRETHNVWNLKLRPSNGEIFPFRPGQFAFLELRRLGHRTEEHPFTIASSPTQMDTISLTIKESGDFTKTIGETKPGDTARILAPYGRFSFLHENPSKIVFIAGGVGITPIMSMIRFLRDTDDERDVILLFANNTESDIIFRDELDTLPKNFSQTYVLSTPSPDWRGEIGFIDSPIIEKHCAGVLDSAFFYICGPVPMMDSVMKTLSEIGIPPRRIRSERFSLN